MLNLNLVVWNCNRACLAACTVTLVQVDELEEFVRWHPATHAHAEAVDKNHAACPPRIYINRAEKEEEKMSMRADRI